MTADERKPDADTATSLGDLTEMLHVTIPGTETYLFRGPKLTLIINENPTSPEERILDDHDE